MCDLIEPVDDSWMSAIEGYLAGARFNFVVAEEHEEEATTFVRDRHLKSRVVQGALCRRLVRPELVPEDSIIHELKTEHPIVLAYLQEQYGQVIKVDRFETLRKTSRGLMKDGRATAGRTYFNALSDKLVFGKAQQAKARVAADEAHKQAELELTRLDNEKKSLTALLMLGRQSKRPNFEGVVVAAEAIRELERVSDELSQLDLREVAELAAKKATLEILSEGCDDKITTANQAIGKLNSDIAAQSQLVAQKEAALPARRQKVAEELQRLKLLAAVNGALSYSALEEQVAQLLEKDGGPQNLVDAVQVQIGRAKDLTSDVRDLVGIQPTRRAGRKARLFIRHASGRRFRASVRPAGAASCPCS
jgi:hypothetical protein